MTEDFELDKRLYEVSDWHDTDAYAYLYNSGSRIAAQFKNNLETRPGYWWYEGINAWPLYDLEYLLDKLPERTEDIRDTVMLGRATDNKGWSIIYKDIVCIAPTPRQAALKLAILLFDNNILKRDSPHGRKER